MRLFALVVLVGWLASCTPEKNGPEAPPNLISKEKMVELMYDIQLIEAVYRGRSYDDSLAMDKVEARLIETYDRHRVTEQQYFASYEYYINDPKMMEDIYIDLLAKLNTRLTEVEGELD